MNFATSVADCNYPGRISTGDTIGIVAPASPVHPERLAAARDYLVDRGFEVRFGRAVDKQGRYLAGSDDERTRDLTEMIAAPDIKAIFCARGGYGSLRLLDRIDYGMVSRFPKALIGFSDLTALQFAIFRKSRLVGYTGFSVAADLQSGSVAVLTEKTLWQLVMEDRFESVSRLRVLRSGAVSGRIFAGCLSVLCSLLGTPYVPDFNGAVLVVEDVNEAPYRIDRMLTQLRLAGILEKLGGLVFGNFMSGKDKPVSNDALDPVLADAARYVDGPVFAGLPYGHQPERIVLPIGSIAELSTVENSGTLAIGRAIR